MMGYNQMIMFKGNFTLQLNPVEIHELYYTLVKERKIQKKKKQQTNGHNEQMYTLPDWQMDKNRKNGTLKHILFYGI